MTTNQKWSKKIFKKEALIFLVMALLIEKRSPLLIVYCKKNVPHTVLKYVFWWEMEVRWLLHTRFFYLRINLSNKLLVAKIILCIFCIRFMQQNHALYHSQSISSPIVWQMDCCVNSSSDYF